MKISVTAKPRSNEELVTKIDDTHFEVAVKEPPVQGRANAAIIKALADYFDLPPYKVSIVMGHTSRQKVVEVEE